MTIDKNIEQSSIVEKSFYLSSIFADIKPEHSWSSNEIKLVLLLFSELSQSRIYIPRLNKENPLIELKEQAKQIQKEYIFTRDDFQNITGVSKAHVAREIKKVVKALPNKFIFTPHPLDKNSEYSCIAIPWFSEISYLDKTGEIYLDINFKALERLIAFVKYTQINFKFIALLKNRNAINLYLFFKIVIDSSKQNQLLMSLDDVKEKLSLAGRYKDINLFRQRVLDVAKNEIKECTDLLMDYQLIKQGKSYSKIKFTFSKKNEFLKSEKTIKEEDHDFNLNFKLENEQSKRIKTEQNQHILQLMSYGISHPKSIYLVETYGEIICKKSIENLLKEISRGTFIKNTGGYLVKCIENSEKTFNSSEISMAINAEKNLKIESEIKKTERFKEFDRYIDRNKEKILPLIEKHRKKEKLYNEEEISVLKSLEELIAEYQDIIKNKTPLTLTYRFNNKETLLTCSTIVQIVKQMKIANKSEMIIELKKQLETKKSNSKHLDDEEKDLIDKEIALIKNRIIDLLG